MNFPLIILVVFLLANLGLGLAKGRGVKTVADYALGDKRFSGGALAMTMLATAIGGNEIYGTSKRLVSFGIVAITGFAFYSVACLLRSFLITNQISRFSNCISFGDFVYKLYGKPAKSFSGFFTGIFCLFQVALQIHVLGLILNDFFGLTFLFSMFCSTICISLYTSFGGMRSVVATDILQFFMIFGTLFCLMFFVIGPLKIFMQGFPDLPNRLFSTKALNGEYFGSRISVLLFLTNIIDISGFQRMLMAKNRMSAKKMYSYTALGMVVVGCTLLVIMFAGIAVLGDNLNVKNPIHYIITKLVHPKFIPFIGLGFIAVIFSTSDSYLHSAGLCLSKDFLEPILKREVKLFEIRVITFFCGIVALIMAILFKGFLDIVWLRYFGTAILVVPVLYGFLGFKSSSKMFWYSAISGFLGLLVASYMPSIQAFRVLVGCFASLFVYFAVHIRENQGFKFIGNPIFPHAEKREIRLKIPTKENFLIRLRETYITHNKLYSTFGIVFGLAIFLRYILFSHYKSPYAEHCFPFAVPALIMCLLAIPTTMYFVWLRLLMPIFWYIILTYCMPFWITLNLILYGCDFWFINFALICIFCVLVVLDRWKSALFILIIGVTAAILVSKSIFSDYPTSDIVVQIPSLLRTALWQTGINGLIGMTLFSYTERYENNLDKTIAYVRDVSQNNTVLISNLVDQSQQNNKDLIKEKDLRLEIVLEGREAIAKTDSEKYLKTLYLLRKHIAKIQENNIVYYLNSSICNINDLIPELRNVVKVAGCSDVAVAVDLPVETILCEKVVLEKTFWKFAKEFCRHHIYGEDTDAILTFSNTMLEYTGEIPTIYKFEKYGLTSVPALCITLSSTDVLDTKDSSVKPLYRRQLDKLITVNFSDVDMKNVIYGIFAHYGVFECNSAKSLWQCVIPFDYSIIKNRIEVENNANRL